MKKIQSKIRDKHRRLNNHSHSHDTTSHGHTSANGSHVQVRNVLLILALVHATNPAEEDDTSTNKEEEENIDSDDHPNENNSEDDEVKYFGTLPSSSQLPPILPPQ
jgi:hypothetical protein